jgi:hypothetical protein
VGGRPGGERHTALDPAQRLVDEQELGGVQRGQRAVQLKPQRAGLLLEVPVRGRLSGVGDRPQRPAVELLHQPREGSPPRDKVVGGRPASRMRCSTSVNSPSQTPQIHYTSGYPNVFRAYFATAATALSQPSL